MLVRKHNLSRDPRNGYYYTRIQVGGVIKRFRFGNSKREAERDLRELEDKIAKEEIAFSRQYPTQVQLPDGTKDIRLESLIHEYLEWVAANRSPSTAETKDHYLNSFLEYAGPCMISSLTPMTLARYREWARARKPTHRKKTKTVCENSGNGHLRHVKCMLLWADSMDICSLPFKKFPEIRESPSRIAGFSDEEIHKLLAVAPPDLRDLVLFELHTGLRPQELYPLKIDNVRVNQQGRYQLLLGEHKTYRHTKKARWVALSSEAADIVRRQIESHPRAKHVFLNDDGNPYCAGSLRQRLERWCKRAGIPKKPPYALRHSYGTRQLAATGDLMMTARLMGHSNIQTTCRYIDEVPEYCQEAVDKLGGNLKKLFGGTPADAETGKNLSPNLSPSKVKRQEESGESS